MNTGSAARIDCAGDAHSAVPATLGPTTVRTRDRANRYGPDDRYLWLTVFEVLFRERIRRRNAVRSGPIRPIGTTFPVSRRKGGRMTGRDPARDRMISVRAWNVLWQFGRKLSVGQGWPKLDETDAPSPCGGRARAESSLRLLGSFPARPTGGTRHKLFREIFILNTRIVSTTPLRF